MSTILALLLGAVGWTLAEYCIHRWFGHDKRLFRNPFGVEHVMHHSRGNYFSPVWKKLAASVLLTGVLWFPVSWLLGPYLGPIAVVGFAAAYLYYEAVHRLEHVHEGLGRYGRMMRTHHFYHHFHDPSVNHGVTSPVWDMVFGTFVKPGVVRVPEKLKMPWLCDPETNEVHDHLQGLYELRRLKRA